jgi:Fe-S cluster biogenesis protein NfuA/nitrite reductase/ring-hydroxylating ferredoxin subunit
VAEAERVQDRELIGRVEARLAEVEGLRDRAAADAALETVQAVLELYGSGLERILERLGPLQVTALATDELVAHLLLLHGLHPVPVEERVREALDGVRPYLGSHGGGVELVGVAGGVATVRLQGTCEGCPASAMTLKLAIEEAVLKAAPDVERVEAEADPAAAPAAAGGGLLQIELVAPPAPEGAWAAAGGLPQLEPGGVLLKAVSGERILFVALESGTRYAYRPDCPGCGGSLEAASLETAGLLGAELECPGCGHRYDVVRAGRCVDAPDLHLEPVPLLEDTRASSGWRCSGGVR